MKRFKKYISIFIITAVLVTSGSLLSIKASAATISNYKVNAGDSLYLISLKYATSVDKLKSLNGLKSDTIYTGQVLKVYQSSANYSASERANPNLYWLSRIIYAEASGEPYLGKVAVGNVVLNRVASRYFPNSVKGVIFEYYKGIPQFSPVADGSIYNIPSTQSIKAALEALRGAKPARDALYFFNPRKSSGSWIARNKTYVTRIGNHVFYK